MGAVKSLLSKFQLALSEGNPGTLADLISDDFLDGKGTTKTELIEHYENLQGLSVDFIGGDLKFSGDLAVFSRVTISSPKGSLSNRLTMSQEEDGAWRIQKSEMVDWESIQMNEEEKLRKYESDQMAMAIRDFREKLLADPARPCYHFVMPEGIAVPFDPNGAIFWRGRYHLFYIFQDRRSGIKQDHWGHVSSTDLFHWRHHPTGLLDGMYSGNCFLNSDGVPTMCYHQVKQGNALAIALDDELDFWQKLESNPITPITEEGDEHHGKYRSWDPFGWLEGDTYYAIFGGKNPGVVKSPKLSGVWQYVGDLFAHGIDGVPLDEDVSCADLFRLGGKDVLLCISHTLGCRYYIGEWKNEQFYPERHEQMSWTDNLFFAPETLIDDKGRRIMWAWLMDYQEFGIRFDQGWSGTMSLPRVLSLDDSDRMLIDLPEEIEALRYGEVFLENFTIPPKVDLPIDWKLGTSFELSIDVQIEDVDRFGVKVCVAPDGSEQTVVAYDFIQQRLLIDTTRSGPDSAAGSVESAPLPIDKMSPLRLRIFVDKSVVEVFANRKQAIARRIYPEQSQSTGIGLFSKGGQTKVDMLRGWKISPSNPY